MSKFKGDPAKSAAAEYGRGLERVPFLEGHELEFEFEGVNTYAVVNHKLDRKFRGFQVWTCTDTSGVIRALTPETVVTIYQEDPAVKIVVGQSAAKAMTVRGWVF